MLGFSAARAAVGTEAPRAVAAISKDANFKHFLFAHISQLVVKQAAAPTLARTPRISYSKAIVTL
jgi:hypothetical protein